MDSPSGRDTFESWSGQPDFGFSIVFPRSLQANSRMVLSCRRGLFCPGREQNEIPYWRVWHVENSSRNVRGCSKEAAFKAARRPGAHVQTMSARRSYDTAEAFLEASRRLFFVSRYRVATLRSGYAALVHCSQSTSARGSAIATTSWHCFQTCQRSKNPREVPFQTEPASQRRQKQAVNETKFLRSRKGPQVPKNEVPGYFVTQMCTRLLTRMDIGVEFDFTRVIVDPFPKPPTSNSIRCPKKNNKAGTRDLVKYSQRLYARRKQLMRAALAADESTLNCIVVKMDSFDLPWRSGLVSCRFGVREAPGSNPSNWAPVHNVCSVVVTPLESRRATSCSYNSSHPVWHALYECLQDIHGDSSPFLLQPFHELSNGFWPRLTSPHPAIQFVPKMFYRVEVGALGGPVHSANIVVGVDGATVAEGLACPPPTMAIRVQSPAGSLRIFTCGNRGGQFRWSVGLLRDLPIPPPLHSGSAPYSPHSPSSTLKTSMLRAAEISSLTLRRNRAVQHRHADEYLPSRGVVTFRGPVAGFRLVMFSSNHFFFFHTPLQWHFAPYEQQFRGMKISHANPSFDAIQTPWKIHYIPKSNCTPVHNVCSVVVTPLESRRATSCSYSSSHPVWHALYECLQDIHGDSSPFLLQPFHELSNGFWPHLTSAHPAIQFVPKMFYRVEVGALGGPVQSANIVVGVPHGTWHFHPGIGLNVSSTARSSEMVLQVAHQKIRIGGEKNGKESAMALDRSQNSPGVISENHGRPKSGWPDWEPNTDPPERDSSKLPLRHLDRTKPQVLSSPQLGKRKRRDVTSRGSDWSKSAHLRRTELENRRAAKRFLDRRSPPARKGRRRSTAVGKVARAGTVSGTATATFDFNISRATSNGGQIPEMYVIENIPISPALQLKLLRHSAQAQVI
ncbi:hypothetical protein PR048_004472 [Dryococelus australis]|uniref:Uncharacterized protein n=1 Tax=Dryococelus australis TaxID=614101 RepID=A0ABQ9I5J3_9NEOP|nr:hypothetical protein PR048_004472 [Dryococelus australis]